MHAENLISKAKIHCSNCEWSSAIGIYKRLFFKKPSILAAGHGLGVCLLALEKPLSAFIVLSHAQKRCTNVDPNLTNAIIFSLQKLASRYTETKKWPEALQCYEKCLALGNKDHTLLADYSICLLRNNKLKKSLKIAKNCLSKNPRNASLHNNLGTIHHEREEFEAAKMHYKKSLELDPNHAKAKLNLAVLYQQTKNLTISRTLVNQHISSFPNDKTALFNLAGLELLEENWDSGWKLYENRDIEKCIYSKRVTNLEKFSIHKNFDYVIAVHEQGLGDTFQFCRYLPYLKKYCQRVYFMGPGKIQQIISDSNLVDGTLNECEYSDFSHEGKGAWVPLMSLPLQLNMTNPKGSYNHQYLLPQQEAYIRWKAKLKTTSTPLIGLHWQGNPDHEFTLSRGRSIHLSLFKKLINNEAYNWISLQKGPGSEQIDKLRIRNLFSEFQNEVDMCWDFSETAAILKCCDLVITSDSGLAHLAGAIGRPTWLLLKQVPEWRWGLEAHLTDWYPSMRLFRQEAYGDWENLINQNIANSLSRFDSRA